MSSSRPTVTKTLNTYYIRHIILDMPLNLRSVAQARRSRGLSQSEVAHRSKTSLATIQNIEAGRANPELATLERIFRVLGLELNLKSAAWNWNPLCSLGVPLLHSGKNKLRPDRELLKFTLGILSQESLAALTDSREISALKSWLRALKDHYPELWAQSASHLQNWIQEQDLTGAEIKLRRLALANLAGFL
jgi:transcriptional regulator with XRE-family HTH domain